ncbi:hypothetical protein LSAT2_023043 [Lamellibrachia satsuma]|nr:hypothetical protein LSAT2_023043 [Lamellibrachia satsuma]
MLRRDVLIQKKLWRTDSYALTKIDVLPQTFSQSPPLYKTTLTNRKPAVGRKKYDAHIGVPTNSTSPLDIDQCHHFLHASSRPIVTPPLFTSIYADPHNSTIVYVRPAQLTKDLRRLTLTAA